MRILQKLEKTLGISGLKGKWGECAPCSDTADEALNERLAEILDVMPPNAYDADGEVNSYGINANFYELAEALALRDQHQRFRPSGEVSSNAPSIEIEGECGEAVSNIFHEFFDGTAWDSVDDMKAAWAAIPDLAKKTRFKNADDYVETPASIYMNARGVYQHRLVAERPPAEVHNIAEYRVA